MFLRRILAQNILWEHHPDSLFRAFLFLLTIQSAYWYPVS